MSDDQQNKSRVNLEEFNSLVQMIAENRGISFEAAKQTLDFTVNDKDAKLHVRMRALDEIERSLGLGLLG